MTRLFVAMFIAVLAVQPNSARAGGTGKPVFGYLNPKTDIFTPAPKPAATTPEPTPIYRQGILIVNANVAIDPSVASTTTFFASVEATTSDTSYTTSVQSGGSVTRSGNTGKLTLKLPYVFTVSAKADVVTIYFSMFSSTGESVSLTQTIPLPASGATTSVSIGEKV